LNGIAIGRLSGIVNHHVPQFLRRKQLPTYQTNCIEDWEPSLKNVDETMDQNMSLISRAFRRGSRCILKSSRAYRKKNQDIFPDFSCHYGE